MTVHKWAEKYCCDRGMFESDAQEVVARVTADPDYKDTAVRWDEETTYYPAPVLVTLALIINSEALKYIDEKHPKAWYRELFV